MIRTAIAITLFALAPAFACAEGAINRTELSRADVPGSDTHEVIVARLEIEPGASVPRHTHHGDEHLVVITGGTMQTGDGKQIPFPDGMAAHFPQGEPHGGLTNAGDTVMIAITTHVVEKGKPLNVPLQ
ncbi:cupin domain-containing protein [Ruegeria sp. 2012CJ41-6]|uniref:Cupin domain-containing protein n=1 Tax=Ruegeria spongiae TaxID=2942209 RepID=A0ABT0PYY2_9RHOB|nr:cupin domain-containing protein [Ruegeria spongiae]MCL6282785.1 cupin domain-containing protein [Ruegeria spongiae]